VAQKQSKRKGLRAAIAAAMPSAIEPMLPTPRQFPFSDPDWIFEPKWDGYRALCLIEHGSVRFMSRNSKELTERFPELATIDKAIKVRSAILDGEIVGLDENDLPCFEDLQNRKKCLVVYFAFDLLMLNGKDLRNQPLIERKSLLERILKKASHVRYTEHIVGEGEQLFAALSKLGLEGMIAKKARSVYAGGRTKDWMKIKTRAGKELIQKRIETWGHKG
jgi:bifunctional non-homologous end joining protein LigD